ncbi:MAG: glycosyltransferase [Bilifractor sp.]
MKKQLLFVINTLGMGGAETALLALLERIDPAVYDVDLYVMLGQGELRRRLPSYVHILNRHYHDVDVLSVRGRRYLAGTVSKSVFLHGSGFRNAGYMLRNFQVMRRKKNFSGKLLWKMIADAAPVPDKQYDLAVAYLEGASTYYVADHVRAMRKAAFLHVDYGKAGYTPQLDHGCYDRVDRIWCVSDEVEHSFLKVYPQYTWKTGVFHNFIDAEKIRKKANLKGGFSDTFAGKRILTVSRLVKQKDLSVSIRAMKILKEERERLQLPLIRWYVLGEGDERRNLEEEIRRAGLRDDFILLGVRDNPYPYMKQADFYVHCTAFEGRSIAVSEAQILGKTVVLSDCSGNRGQVVNGKDGMLVPFDAASIAAAVVKLMEDPRYAEYLGKNAAHRDFEGGNIKMLLDGDVHR